MFPEFSDEALVAAIESWLSTFGMRSILVIWGIFIFSSFFFIPVLIPLTIACGALYGAVYGSGVAIAGIVLGCLASTLSVRYVFKGLGKWVFEHRSIQELRVAAGHHDILFVFLVRLAFVVPYLLQNIVLAMLPASVLRLMALTLVSALPGAISYSLIGAGLFRASDTREFAMLLAVPLLILLAVSLFINKLKRRTMAANPKQNINPMNNSEE